MEQLDAHVPVPGPERGAWGVALALGALGLAVLVLALSGVLGGAAGDSTAPPPVLAVTPTPTPATASAEPVPDDDGGHAAILGNARGEVAPGGARAAVAGEPVAYLDATTSHIPESWMRGFYPIYATAQRSFGVNWLLIASIHRQESAFSTAPGIYHGLNFAGCCGGPMQFNVTNGGPAHSPGGAGSTWSLVSGSYRYAARPASYDHMTARHPSIYDDFDSIMAAAHLLSSDGAGSALDGSAWDAAYDYYGHDLAGVEYADQVLARAIAWSQHGFCINCGIPQAMVQAVHAAYGAPVAASLETEAATVAARERTAKRPRPPGRSARRRRGR